MLKAYPQEKSAIVVMTNCDPGVDQQESLIGEIIQLFDNEWSEKLEVRRIKIEITLCGNCIEICPYTQGYIRRNIAEQERQGSTQVSVHNR